MTHPLLVLSIMYLIPLLSFAVAAALVVLKVFKQRRANGDGKGIRFIRSDGNKASRHLPTVQIARYAAVHVSNLFGIKIVGCIEVKPPVFGWLYISVEAQVMGKLVLIFQRIRIKITIAKDNLAIR